MSIRFEKNEGAKNNIEIKFETPVNLEKITVTETVIPLGLATVTPTIMKATETLPALTVPVVVSTATLGIDSTKTGKDGMTLVYVPAGKFIMGAKAEDALAQCQKYLSDCRLSWFKDEEPPHEVYLDAYWIDQTEVTNKMYSLCVNAQACKPPKDTMSRDGSNYYDGSKYDYYPVSAVDWSMAHSYCQWAGRELPTEAQWEKAARGTDERIFPWGNDINLDLANYSDFENFSSIVRHTTAVGSYENGKSPYGAYDMAGNVWEWVSDWYDPAYYATLGNDSINPERLSSSGQYRVLRGGAWTNPAAQLRSADRLRMEPSSWDGDFGFRCALYASP